jgi:hypothetical protein
MGQGSETYLFRARSEEEQADREGAVKLILSSLVQVSKSAVPTMVGLSPDGVDLLTWLIDLGVAPQVYPPSQMIRQMSAQNGGVMMVITPETAGLMISMAARGEIRHRAGASDPSTIRIH